MQVRNRVFRFVGDIPKHWHGDGPFITHFLNAQSVIFPLGEQFFVNSLRLSGETSEEIKIFCAQEAYHGRAHAAFNRWLEQQGYQVSKLEGLLKGLLGFWKRSDPKTQMAFTVCAEHFTTSIARYTLNDPRLLVHAHPAGAEILRWHALEEIEHKSVAFDVYQRAGGGYFRRVITFLLATASIGTLVGINILYFLWKDGLLFHPGVWARGLICLFIFPGPFVRLLPHYLAFFRPSFHPKDTDDRQTLAEWQEKFAA